MSRERLFQTLSARGNLSFATVVSRALGFRVHFESIA